MNILEVQNLCKTYGKGETAVQALRDVTFSVHKGEFVAIVGESGSGKSTLLNVVGALDNPTAGKVLIDGKDIFSMPEKKLTVFRRQHIGFIFQSFNLMWYALNSVPAKSWFSELATGASSSMQNISINDFTSNYLPIPAFSEQKEIADYLDAKCAEIDRLIAKKEQLVKELESYKKSLIYEVVTGKREV